MRAIICVLGLFALGRANPALCGGGGDYWLQPRLTISANSNFLASAQKPVVGENSNTTGTTAEPTPEPGPERELWEQLNQSRTAQGLPRLRWNRKLAEAARQHARGMLKRGQLSHQFDGEEGLERRVAHVGLSFDNIGENIGFASDPGAMHAAWMKSPGHRANILSEKFDEGGIGVEIGPHHRFYGVQDFAHVVAAIDPGEVEALVFAELNRARNQLGKKRLMRFSLQERASMQCPPPSNFVVKPATAAGPTARTHHTLQYSTSNPQVFPRELGTMASAEVSAIFISACSVRNDLYPQGMWYVVVGY